MPGPPVRPSFTPGRANVSPSGTQGGSRVPELGPLGSGAARLAAIPAGASPPNRGDQLLPKWAAPSQSPVSISPPATCFRPWSARGPPLDVVRGKREPICCAQCGCNHWPGFISSTVPATGPQGSGLDRPAQSFCSDDHKGRGGSLGRKVARPPAPARGGTARYFAVISAGMAAPSLAKQNVLPSTQIR